MVLRQEGPRAGWDRGPAMLGASPQGCGAGSGLRPRDGGRWMWVVVFGRNLIKDFPKCLFRLLWLGELPAPEDPVQAPSAETFPRLPRSGADRCFLCERRPARLGAAGHQ